MHELIFVEESTWKQNRSTTWYEQRIECITGAIAHKTSSIISTSLIKCICQSQYQPINSAALKWGREHETLALNYYKSVMLDTCLPSKPKLICNVRKHVNFECTSIGLVTTNTLALELHQMLNFIANAVTLVFWNQVSIFPEELHTFTSHS